MTHQTGSPSMESLVNELFQRYEREFNRSLRGDSDLVAVANLYAKAFIAATPSGVVTGQNDEQLKKVMADGFERYRQIGMSGMKLQRLDIFTRWRAWTGRRPMPSATRRRPSTSPTRTSSAGKATRPRCLARSRATRKP